ncbi:Hypothetical predicted protein [Olea europaea subsp. europaea]|uniref:Disease resistance R13L4/SHOC-2-like LRR domain-containing protein n=1 Tax=Olea europaea subsp. europaea TaxID=158383 RepID=A0A8S0SDM0_OLEEU|nr:Hypothetical predicted protein [Olea europaea subsp. europaea]
MESPSSLPFGLHVRSLLYDFSFVSSVKLISCSYKVLRVFDFKKRSTIWDLVIGYENLVHLRYLAIPFICQPLDLERFHKLEFLVVDNGDEVEIPEILLNMVSLRHMEFKGGAYFGESSCQLATNRKSFQINILQSISVLSIHDEMDEKILRCLPNLQRLKSKLKTSLNHSFDFLNQLESLNLFFYSTNLIGLPLNLKKLRLQFGDVSRKQMEIIGRLPYLEVLKLESVVFEGEQWNTSEGEFPQLKYLKLVRVFIAEWNASSDNFPRLQLIVLNFCRNLKMIPSSLGDIPTLQKIQVYRCGQTINESAKKIEEEQKEMGNEELEVIISE